MADREELKARLAGLAGTFPSLSPHVARALAYDAAEVIAALEAEVAKLHTEAAKLRQDRYDALSVTSKDGLLSSEWIARTGRAERRAKEMEAEVEKLGQMYEQRKFTSEEIANHRDRLWAICDALAKALQKALDFAQTCSQGPKQSIGSINSHVAPQIRVLNLVTLIEELRVALAQHEEASNG